jgi:mobilome CxxCx(11)CxxC protein
MEELHAKIRTDCWNNALDTLGFSYIFSKKIAKIERWLRWSKVLGIIIPVILGGLVTTYYNNKEIMNWALGIASPIALAQLVVSTYLVVVGSDEKLSRYMSKSAEYGLLRGEFEQLAKYPISDLAEYKHKFEILSERASGIGKGNYDVKDADRRMGMRFGLREFSRECVQCKTIPYSMIPTKCDVCGNFKL